VSATEERGRSVSFVAVVLAREEQCLRARSHEEPARKRKKPLGGGVAQKTRARKTHTEKRRKRQLYPFEGGEGACEPRQITIRRGDQVAGSQKRCRGGYGEGKEKRIPRSEKLVLRLSRLWVRKKSTREGRGKEVHRRGNDDRLLNTTRRAGP